MSTARFSGHLGGIVHPLSIASWDTSHCEQNDWQTGVKTLPSRYFVSLSPNGKEP